MIRHRRGDEFLLVTQHDHAQLSGRLATHLGNSAFAPPSPYRETVDGIALHDCGWPLHDDEPTLNPQGQPLHVLESPMLIATRVWTESARRAAEVHPYTGLLVSLHVLALSDVAQKRDQSPHERFRDARDLFELNKFQHRQVELQESLRRGLGMRTDVPLQLGLAEPNVDPDEDLLRFNYNLLKLLDRLSLDACCSEDLFDSVEGVHPRRGEAPLTLRIGHSGPGDLKVDPWPFHTAPLQYEVPCRRLPAQKYESDDEFRAAYRAAPRDTLTVALRP